MTKAQTVRKAMGLVQFQFVDISNGSYKYTNSSKYYKMQAKWKKHIPALRGRSQAIILTAEKPANSKSGSSYDILGVFAILENHGELEMLNEDYWNSIKTKTTDADKIIATKEFADRTIELFLENGREHHHVESTLAILNVLATAAATPKIAKAPTPKTQIRGLTF